MELTNFILDEENEKILSKLDNTIGLSKNKEVIRKIIMYHEVMQKYKCNVESENYNIVIRNKSSYNLYEELISVISEIYYKNKITLQPNALYITRGDLRLNRLKREAYKNIEEGIIVLDLTTLRRDVDEIRKSVEKMIEYMPTKSFIILENEYQEGETNALFIEHFSWSMKIDVISTEEKEKYVENFMKSNELVCDTKLIKEIADNPYYKVKNKLLNIWVNCKINENNNVDFLMDKREKEQEKEENKKTGIEELNELIGLEDVKKQLKKIINYIKISKNRANLPMLHMVFNGNPGTGKTTVARIIGKIFAEENILSDKNIFVEAQRNDLIGKYVGHTAPKTQEIIDKSIGGVLFVDEAYSIASYIQDEGGRDYGAECISTLLKGMEDHRDDLCVILAGYTKEMQHMLSVNPGFESRIQFLIDFPDYTSDELYEIFKQLCKKEKYKISSNIKKVLIQHFDSVKNKKNFSNARYVRSLFEKIKIEQANRVIKDNSNKDMIKCSDITLVIEKIEKEGRKQKNRIGFEV